MPSIPYVATGGTISATRANQVADALNNSALGTTRIQAGEHSGTTNASGDITVTFPVAFGSTTGLAVVGTIKTTAAYVVALTAVTTTTATFRVRALSDGSVLASGGLTLHWFAKGPS